MSLLGLIQVNVNAPLVWVARVWVSGNSDKWIRTRTCTRVCV